MGAGASTDNSGEIVVGDVVTFHVEDHPKRVVGIVTDRIAKWDEIEVGDVVKVKEQGSRLYYEAEVVSRNENGTYKVHFVEVDEEEDNVSADRMLKLMSGRLEDKEWMMYKETEE
ncbi:hypothetical protein PRIC2_009110 [Phytophthora ramorum]